MASRKHKRSVVALLQTSENVTHSLRKWQLYVDVVLDTIIIGNQSVIQGLHGRVRGQSHRDGALLGDSLRVIIIFIKLLNNDKKYASKLVIRSVIVKFLLCLKTVNTKHLYFRFYAPTLKYLKSTNRTNKEDKILHSRSIFYNLSAPKPR